MLTKREMLKGLTAAGLAGMAGTRAARASGRPGFFAAKDIAEAGFIYGLPLVMNYGVMHAYAVDPASGQYKAPFNTLFNEARVFTWRDTSIPTPNSDTPYSLAWLDLRAEPVVISVPAVEARRYYSVQLVDANTYNYGYIGSRATGNGAGDYLVAGPDWSGQAPRGIAKVFRASTWFALTIFRTQLFNAADMAGVKAVQAGYKVRPLSAFLGAEAPPPAPRLDFPAFSADLARTEFFEFLDFALRFAPAMPDELWIREQLARIGVGPGRGFAFSALSVADKAEILLGMKEGLRKVEAGVAALGADINGWRVGAASGDAAFFHGDWLLRAVGAKAGIYGNDPEEATYPLTRQDAQGAPLDGSKANYTLTFPKDGLPPVNAFWSVTLYDGTTQLLIKNPIDRYLINSPMLDQMKRNADGSLTLYIQKDSPGAEKESNWLPAPDGPIYLVMRLYWPKTGTPSILPPGAGSWKPPGVMRG
ncbi:MAG: DUF1254 domain-containing protein [Pseudomonadota bacterium]